MVSVCKAASYSSFKIWMPLLSCSTEGALDSISPNGSESGGEHLPRSVFWPLPDLHSWNQHSGEAERQYPVNPLIQLERATPVSVITLLLACFGLLNTAQAVNPPPDGGYPGGNTAEGNNALLSLTTGVWNTAVGNQALKKDTGGGGNTATGFQALFNTTTGNQNTAHGSIPLYQYYRQL